MKIKEKIKRRERRKKRIRSKIEGTRERPRLCVFRSNKHIYCQLIDDTRGETIISASDLELKSPKIQKKFTRKVGIAFEVGKLIAKKALEKEIKKVAFDKGCYKYHGRVKALAEGAREGGLKF